MYQVRGTVLYKDGTVPKGGVAVVNFRPTTESTAEVRNGASGAIGSDGSFTMFTRVAGDGVYAGEYAVTFTVIKSPMDATSLILPKFTNSKDPPYKVKVDRDLTDLKYQIEPLPGVTGAPRSSAAQPANNSNLAARG